MISQLLRIPLLGKVIKKVVYSIEGGEFYSKTARRYMMDTYNVRIGMYSYGGCFSDDFNSGGEVKVGRYCSIAMNVHYLAGNHPIMYISTSPYFFQEFLAKRKVRDITRTNLTIENDVWIGYGTIITPGCSFIGNGAIIGAGSIVTHDVPAYSIVAGNPAKIIGSRFSEEEINALESSQWWNYDPEYLLKYYSYIDDVFSFVENLKI